MAKKGIRKVFFKIIMLHQKLSLHLKSFAFERLHVVNFSAFNFWKLFQGLRALIFSCSVNISGFSAVLCDL